jgi:hypothetical protein
LEHELRQFPFRIRDFHSDNGAIARSRFPFLTRVSFQAMHHGNHRLTCLLKSRTEAIKRSYMNEKAVFYVSVDPGSPNARTNEMTADMTLPPPNVSLSKLF